MTHKITAETYTDFIDFKNLIIDSLGPGGRVFIYLKGDFYCEWYSEPNWDLVEEAQMEARRFKDNDLFATLREEEATQNLYFDIYKLVSM